MAKQKTLTLADLIRLERMRDEPQQVPDDYDDLNASSFHNVRFGKQEAPKQYPSTYISPYQSITEKQLVPPVIHNETFVKVASDAFAAIIQRAGFSESKDQQNRMASLALDHADAFMKALNERK